MISHLWHPHVYCCTTKRIGIIMKTKPKRVIWITSDHMRYDCINSYGNHEIFTPNLDLLAKSGINFTGCYCQNPTCMPSRASFFTGMYPQQTGVTSNGHCLSENFKPTAAGMFQNLGYQTVHIGKLHLQPHEDRDLDLSAHNYRYGFDKLYLSESRGCYDDAYMKWLRGTYPEYVEAMKIARPFDRKGEGNGCVVDAPLDASHSGWISNMAINYLKYRTDSQQFMHLGFHNPHPPLNPVKEAFEPYRDKEITIDELISEEWKDKPEPLATMLKIRQGWEKEDFIEYKRYFYALVTELDFAIGKLFDFLKAENLLDDTLIVFSSDHGDMCGNHSLTHKQAHFYDEVMHLPLILHWPNKFGREKKVKDGFVEMMDVLPSLLELSGGRIPAEMAGKSFAGEIRKEGSLDIRDCVFAFNEPDYAMVRTEQYKYIRYNSTGGEVLYDLSLEPKELKNKIDDPSYTDVRHVLREKMLARCLDAGRSIQKKVYVW